MAAGKTYTRIGSTTASGGETSVTFSSIPQTYTDLVLVVNAHGNSANGNYIYSQWGNGSVDTGTNYSTTVMSGYVSGGSGAKVSTKFNTRSNFNMDYYATPATTPYSLRRLHIMNYSNTTTYKAGILRADRGDSTGGTDQTIGVWRSTSAINIITITIDQNSYGSGSMFTLYGIAAA
jgi:hypothetical protein